jgi:rhodanese-related sulfurtransferase
MFNSVSVNELTNLSEINIIDLRSVEKYNFSHIPGSINISSDKLLLNPDLYIRKDLKYYVYCQHGITSRSVCNILCKLGYNLVNIDGGFESWLLRKY